MYVGIFCFFFFFKQKTAYEMRISDWSSDVCSSDLGNRRHRARAAVGRRAGGFCAAGRLAAVGAAGKRRPGRRGVAEHGGRHLRDRPVADLAAVRSEEHTSELQSLMRISYAVFCLKKKKRQQHQNTSTILKIINKNI